MITAIGWKPPGKEEVVRMIQMTGCANKKTLASRIGYRSKRAIEKWASGETTMPFVAWFTIRSIAQENSKEVLGDGE